MAFDIYAAQSAIDAANSATSSVISGVESSAVGTLRQVDAVTSRIASSFAITAQNTADTGKAVIQQTVNNLQSLFSSAREKAVELGSAVIGGLASVRGAVLSGFAGAAGSAAAMAATVGQRVAAYIAGLAPGLVSVFGGLASSLSTTLGAIQSGLSAAFAPLSFVVSLGPTVLVAASVIAGVVTVIASLALRMTGLAMAVRWYSFLGNAITTAFSTISSVATAFVTNFQAGLTFVASIIRSGLTVVAGLARTAFGFATQAGQFILSNAGSVVSGLASLASVALKAGGALLQFVGAGSVLAVFAGAAVYATQAVMEMAKSAKDLSSASGLGLARSSSLLDSFGIQGVGASAVQGVYANQSPFVANMKARAFNLPDVDSASFGTALARKFQDTVASGPLGITLARAMTRSIGVDSPEFLRLANTSPATQRANTTFQRTIDSNLGLSPSVLRGYAETVPALVSRVGYAFQKLVQVFAAEILPVVVSGLTAITQYVGANAGSIRDTVAGAVKLIFTRVYPAFIEGGTVLITMFSAIVTGLVSWGQWLVTVFPQVLANGAQVVSNVLRGWTSALATWAPTFLLGMVTFLSQIGINLALFVYNVGSGIADQIEAFSAAIYNLWQNNGGPLQTLAIAIATGLDAIINTSIAWGTAVGNIVARVQNILATFIPGIMPTTPAAAVAAATGGLQPTNLAAGVARFFAGPTLPRVAQGLGNSAAALRTNATNAAYGIYNGMNDLALGAGYAGRDIARGLNRAGNGLADGTTNLAAAIGQGVANAVRPGLNALEKVEPGIRDFASAAQQYKESLGTEKDISIQYEMLQEQRKNNDLQQQGNSLLAGMREQIRQNGFGGVDRAQGIILNSFAREAAAVEMAG